MSLLKRKTKTEYITPDFYKDWGNTAYELENLGRRLDAVRATIARLEAYDKPEDHWAVVQWRQAEDIILRKWKHTIRLKDTGLRQAGKIDTGPKVSYDWWEGSDEPVMTLPLFDHIYSWLADRAGNTNFDRVWEMAREEKLQKARQGLA